MALRFTGKIPLIFAALLLAVFGQTLAPAAPPTQAQIERDLVLEAVVKSPASIQPGQAVEVSLVLRNQSREITYPVVKPGDGSEVGWREPYVYFTATVETAKGITVPVPQLGRGRCGLFAHDWPKDVILLKPGAEMPLNEWLIPASGALNFQEPGRIKLIAHYQYRAGLGKRPADPAAIAASAIAGVPAFAIVSKPVEFDVVRRLELQLKAKAPLRAKTRTKLSDFLDLRLVNSSGEQIAAPIPSYDGPVLLTLPFMAKVASIGSEPKIEKRAAGDIEPVVLPPGQAISLLGPGANQVDGIWEYPQAETIKIRYS
jgi:hypothetical protein